MSKGSEQYDLRKAAEMALEALSEYTGVVTSGTDPTKWDEVVDGGGPAREAIQALRQALAQPEKKSKLNWFPAPTKIEWGESMVCTTVEIDADHYFDVFSEECQKENVELMLGFTKREWVGLTEEEFFDLLSSKTRYNNVEIHLIADVIRATQAKLKEKNT